MSKSVLIGLFAIACLYLGVQALRCFSCHGSLESDCAQNSSDAAVVQECYRSQKDIPSKSDWGFVSTAIDYIQKTDENVLDEDVKKDGKTIESVCAYVQYNETDRETAMVHRTCQVSFDRPDEFCKYMKNMSHVVECHSCYYDLCN